MPSSPEAEALIAGGVGAAGADTSARASFFGLVGDEAWDLLRRPRVGLLALVLIAGVGWMLIGVRDGRGGQEAWWSLLREFVLIPLALGLPLLVGLISGTALAADRRDGVVGQWLSRGVSRFRWALSRVAASSLAAFLIVGAVVTCLALLIRIIGPSSGTSEVFAAVPIGFPAGGTALALTFGLFAGAAAVFWACVCCLVGMLTTNLFVVFSVPVVANLIVNQAGDVFAGVGLEHLMTLNRLGPGPAATTAVWVFGSLLAVAAALMIAVRRDTLD